MIENVNYNTKKQQFEIGESSGGETIDAYTKIESNNKFATKTEVGNYLLKTDATTTYATKATTYTKTEADGKFALKTGLTDLETRVTALENAGA